IDKGRTWVKLSVTYDSSKVGPPTYADVNKIGEAYVKAAPERMLWEAIGRTRTRPPSLMMPGCSTFSPNGRRASPHAGVSWSRTRKFSTASRKPLEHLAWQRTGLRLSATVCLRS